MKLILIIVILSDVLAIHLDQLKISTIFNNLGISDKELEKKIYRKVHNDKQIREMILQNSTGSERFNKLVINKTISQIRNHPQYLKTLTNNSFRNSQNGLEFSQKLKLLKAMVYDNSISQLLMTNQSDQNAQKIAQKMAKVIKSDPQMLQKIALTQFTNFSLSKSMTKEQKIALFQIIVDNSYAAADNNATKEQIQHILNQAKKDNRLKQLTQNKQNQLKQMLTNYLT